MNSSQPSLKLQLEVVTTSNTCNTSSDTNTKESNGSKAHQMNLTISHEPHPTPCSSTSNFSSSITTNSNNLITTINSPVSNASKITPLSVIPTQSQISYTLELLDLTSFHSSQILSCTPQDQLPLKAVYKASVVGLRYIIIDQSDLLLGKGKKCKIGFCRFQVKFKSKEQARDFVERISKVCPVKVAEVQSSSVPPKDSGSGSSTTGKSEVTVAQHSPRPLVPPQLPVQTRPQPTLLIPSPQSLPPPSSTSYNRHQIPQHQQPILQSHQSKLPPHLSNIFPNLAASLQPPPLDSKVLESVKQQVQVKNYNCTELSNMEKNEFENLLEEILMDEGFEFLVDRVRGVLKEI